MKKIFSKQFFKLPDFIQNKRLRLLAMLLIMLATLSVGISFILLPILGWVMLVLVILVIIFAYQILYQIEQSTSEYLNDLSYRIKQGRQEAMIQMPLGIMLYGKNKEVEWVNPTLQRLFGKDDILGRSLRNVDHNLEEIIEKYHDDQIHEISWRNRHFRILIQDKLNAIYLLDITHYDRIKQEYEDTRIVIGQIFLDNYDEVIKSMNDKDISNLSNYITNTLVNWARQYNMFLKRVDNDHYIVIAYTEILTDLEKDKFKVLDRIRENTSKRNSPLTLSMGFAYGGRDLSKLAKVAQNNLDLALGRGGDQVVVKELSGQARFYGGKTSPMEKRTRVRARMISQALRELMRQSDQIFVVGHIRPDMDAIGSCLGIRRLAEMNGKECFIVLDEENFHSDIKRLLEVLNQHPKIRDKIISPRVALEKATSQSMLIMVDHSKPSISISQKLYEKISNRVMIIDHHRRGEEFPQNPILVYIEPYASSTSELVTELFEYQTKEGQSINRIEATAMLTGIMVDTKSFSLRTGTRTFDAASYLRSLGADLKMARHFMKESINSYMDRIHLIDRVEFIGDGETVCAGEEGRVYDPVIAAQAADSLLEISGVKASYVITQRSGNKVGISARSNGGRNVQVIMEQMGGGGHLSNAATQIEGQTITEVKHKLLEILALDEDNQDSY